MNKILLALQAGQSLRNRDKWKRGQELTNLIGALGTGVIAAIQVFFPDVLISDEACQVSYQIVGGVLVAVNLYLTRATSKRVGFKPKEYCE